MGDKSPKSKDKGKTAKRTLKEKRRDRQDKKAPTGLTSMKTG